MNQDTATTLLDESRDSHMTQDSSRTNVRKNRNEVKIRLNAFILSSLPLLSSRILCESLGETRWRPEEARCTLLDLNIQTSLWRWTEKQPDAGVERQKNRAETFPPTQQDEEPGSRGRQLAAAFLLKPHLHRYRFNLKTSARLWR